MLKHTAIFLLSAAALFGQAANEHWVATWAASAQQPRVAPAPTPAAQIPQIQQQGPITVGATPAGQNVGAGITVTPAVIPGGPVAAPVAAPANLPISSFNNQTVRMTVRTTIGGRRARVSLTNAHGTAPVMIGAARLALKAKGSDIVAGSDKALSFGGRSSAMIPSGASIYSDPVDFNVPQDGDVAISIYIPGDTGPATTHSTGLHTTYVANGDLTSSTSLADAKTSQSWFLLGGVDVMAPANTSAIVAFGDSITDGARSTPDTNSSWPSQFAKRLTTAGATNIAVINHGISGNRVLRDDTGTNALARFNRDVLGTPGVKWVIFLEGINDIGRGNRANALPADATNADDLIAGMKQFIEKAHTNGIKVAGATVLPYEGAAYYSESGETVRAAVNQWIRSSKAFDAVIDFDAATRDPQNPKRMRADLDSGDKLHPGDAGYKAMADAIDLSIFGLKAASANASR